MVWLPGVRAVKHRLRRALSHSPAVEEADYLLVKLFGISVYGKELPLAIRDKPTIEEFIRHLEDQPGAVKKLAAYDLAGLFKREKSVRVTFI